MSQEWTGLQAVIDAVNVNESRLDRGIALQALTSILLAKINLTTSDMSDAIQEAFLLHESLSEHEIRTIVDTFDSHLASLKN